MISYQIVSIKMLYLKLDADLFQVATTGSCSQAGTGGGLLVRTTNLHKEGKNVAYA